ncbi:response regulator [Paraburkholderia adhaesiva]|uniref:response regulator n=1 Tax=Paraburkholderia adhaesiva TaxID=2883244 RepID=UPI001F3BE84C|nr:response regulator [Paraburkholderia adhaesiva]
MSDPNPAPAGCTRAPGPQRVLVVDDDTMNLRFAARLLRDLGYSGALASDGHKALRLIDEQPFDLVLLDINMPGMNGQDTLKALRARPGKRLPVLMVSGHGDDDTVRHFSSLGADGLLLKPLAAVQLRQAIARTTGR